MQILRAGKLPCRPLAHKISENRIGALLVQPRFRRCLCIVLSVIVTLACLLLFYRFSGE